MWSNVLLAALLCTNAAAFVLMGLDKHRARRNKWRIRETTLVLASGLFGALGGTLGMHVFRHKTRHWYFRWGFPAMLAVQCALLAWLWPML